MSTNGITTLELLNDYCQKMADSIIPLLDGIDLYQYQAFLEMMYHYTLDSGKRLLHAADQAQNEEVKSVFAELAYEEQYHYRLAAADLKTYGKVPKEEKSPIIEAFDHYWLSIAADEEYQYVGALYVLENVARFLKNPIMPHLTRLNIGAAEGKFIMTHLVADDDHGDQLSLLCQNVTGAERKQLEMGAQKASEFWIAIHQKALENAH